ncbi:hypothetical protein MTP99_005917 [Tenebrio molitor]|nr:hypothetical protein MTP99_005917 [Tenebrio molitor]
MPKKGIVMTLLVLAVYFVLNVSAGKREPLHPSGEQQRRSGCSYRSTTVERIYSLRTPRTPLVRAIRFFSILSALRLKVKSVKTTDDDDEYTTVIKVRIAMGETLELINWINTCTCLTSPILCILLLHIITLEII